MKIECEAIDSNHEFLVDKRVIKQLFKRCEIEINFKKGNVSSVFKGKTLPESSRKQKVASLYIVSSDFVLYSNPFLNIYSVDKKYLTDSLKKQFSEEILPKIYSLFVAHKPQIEQGNEDTYRLSVYLLNGKFIMKEKTEA